MHKLLVYLEIKYFDLNTFFKAFQGQVIETNEVFTELILNGCQVRFWNSGKIECTTSSSKKAAVKTIEILRQRLGSEAANYPRVITHSFEVDGKVKLPVKRLADYVSIYQAETQDLFATVIRKHPELLVDDIDNIILALSKYATTDLVYIAKIDNHTAKLKYIILDNERRTRIISKLESVLNNIRQEKKVGGSRNVDILVKVFSNEKVKLVAEAIILGILANTIFEYFVKPLIELILRRTSPLRKSIYLEDLVDDVPELSYLTSKEHADLVPIAQSVGKNEWDTLATLNWLISKRLVLQTEVDGELRFSLSGKQSFPEPTTYLNDPVEKEVTLDRFHTYLPSELLE
ncbi:MAG: hypothetical protein GY797_22610 [Deltaproteobacteria bacterium]|nr:hypothetical protein [Deltaproteobacteria bacterium]